MAESSPWDPFDFLVKAFVKELLNQPFFFFSFLSFELIPDPGDKHVESINKSINQ